MSKHTISRRGFLATAASGAMAAGCATRVNTAQVVPGKISPNERLNIAAIGIGGMGKANLNACAGENIVALCDVDDQYAAGTFSTYPNAKRFKDFRKMFDAEANNIDAVIVATPDHSHAIIAMTAMHLGKHVYCQKPMAHSLYEVRKMTETAQACKVQTQLGNQGHSQNAARTLCEWIADGAIGQVREMHAWTDRPVGGDPWSDFPIMKRPEDTPEVPASLDWDLWLGPAPFRPYNPIYHPLTWRGWYDFGTGSLGDIGCHVLDPGFWALNLGYPEWVEGTTTHYEPEVAKETYPRASIVRYKFPKRGNMDPVTLTWYDGRLKPPIPDGLDPRKRLDDTGAIFIGDKGVITHGFYGAQDLRLWPKERMQEYKKPPETLPRVKDEAHELDWIRACKDGKPASSHFAVSGPLCEMILLGVISTRVKDRRLNWDGKALQFVGDDEANALLNPPCREGWSL